jgi:hypothetical protein
MLPLLYPGQNSAPWVPAAYPRFLSPSLLLIAESCFWSTGCGSTFRQLSLSSRRAPLTSRCRPLTQAIHLLSIRYRRVKSTTCSGVHVTPASFRLTQSPLVAYHLRQAPTNHRGASLPRPLYGRPAPAGLSSTFADSHPVCFPLAGVLTVVVGLTTLLSIALRRCRPTASPVRMLPLFLQAEQYSPTSRRVPIMTGVLANATFA